MPAPIAGEAIASKRGGVATEAQVDVAAIVQHTVDAMRVRDFCIFRLTKSSRVSNCLTTSAHTGEPSFPNASDSEASVRYVHLTPSRIGSPAVSFSIT